MTDAIAAAPPAPPPAYKDRRTALIIFGVIEILIGLFSLGMILLVALVLAAGPVPPQGNSPLPPAALFAGIAVFYGVVGAFFITVGIGSIRARRWARIAMLVASSIWLTFGIFAMLVVSFIFLSPAAMESAGQQSAHPLDATTMRAVMVFSIVATTFIYVVLPLTFLLFYASKNVKATCDSRTGNEPRPPALRPIAVAVYSWFVLVSLAISVVIMLSVRRPVPFFGMYLSGSAALAYMAGWTAVF